MKNKITLALIKLAGLICAFAYLGWMTSEEWMYTFGLDIKMKLLTIFMMSLMLLSLYFLLKGKNSIGMILTYIYGIMALTALTCREFFVHREFFDIHLTSIGGCTALMCLAQASIFGNYGLKINRIFSWISVTLGTISIIGYSLSMPSLYSVSGDFSKGMALPTAICFILSGMASKLIFENKDGKLTLE